jgi:hypothetical protein
VIHKISLLSIDYYIRDTREEDTGSKIDRHKNKDKKTNKHQIKAITSASGTTNNK